MKYWASYGQLSQPHLRCSRSRQGSAPCLGCSVYYAAVGHGKGTWDGIGGPLRNIDFAKNFSLSAPPPFKLLPLFHDADSNTPTPASCEATDLQEAVTCEFE